MKPTQILRHGLLSAAILVIAAAAPPLSAQTQRLSLGERVDKLEQQANGAGGGSSVDLVNQIQALQSQVQMLQGQVEELKHQLDQVKQNGKDQYIDLDSRIGRLEGTAPAGAPPAGARPATRNDAPPPDIELGTRSDSAPPAREPPNRTTPNVGDLREDERGDLAAPAGAADSAAPADAAGEQATYDAAFAALKEGRYAESARRFQAFLDSYPNSALAGNAYYWLGESYYVTQNYKIALQSFQTLLQQFPESQKAPDALLKVGYSQYELKQWDQAEATLNQVVQTYPDTTVARLAQGRLRALKLETRR